MPLHLKSAVLLAIASSAWSCSFDTSPIENPLLASAEGASGNAASASAAGTTGAGTNAQGAARNLSGAGSAPLPTLLDASATAPVRVDAGPSALDAGPGTAPSAAATPPSTTTGATSPPPSAAGTPPSAAGAAAPAWPPSAAAPIPWPSAPPAVTGTTAPWATAPTAGTGSGMTSWGGWPPSAAKPDAGAQPAQPPTAAGCATPSTSVQVNATIDVAAGQTFDGHCQRYSAGSGLIASATSTTEVPMFRLEAGALMQNVVLDSSGAIDGIHTYGDATLSNIVWEQIGGDALTSKASGTVTIDGGSATHAPNAVFQLDVAGTLRVSNFRATDAGRLVRQNSGTAFRVDVFIDRCDISTMTDSIFRTDSSTSTITMTNTRYSMITGGLFIGVDPMNIVQSGNTEY